MAMARWKLKQTISHSHEWVTLTESRFEGLLFWTRWVLAPAYAVLAISLVVLSYKSAEELVQLVINLRVFDETRTILQILTIVDLVLVLNLVLLIMFVGYVNFVSKIHTDKTEDWPAWMGYLDYSGLKVQLMGSIIAIASIKMLRTFLELVDVGKVENDKLFWMVILYLSFLFAALFVAIINKLKVKAEHESYESFNPDKVAAKLGRDTDLDTNG